MNQEEKKTIVLGVTGSIAAYKAADLASSLTKGGHAIAGPLSSSCFRPLAWWPPWC